MSRVLGAGYNVFLKIMFWRNVLLILCVFVNYAVAERDTRCPDKFGIHRIDYAVNEHRVNIKERHVVIGNTELAGEILRIVIAGHFKEPLEHCHINITRIITPCELTVLNYR